MRIKITNHTTQEIMSKNQQEVSSEESSEDEAFSLCRENMYEDKIGKWIYRDSLVSHDESCAESDAKYDEEIRAEEDKEFEMRLVNFIQHCKKKSISSWLKSISS